MPEIAIAPVLVPRKPVVSADDNVQSVALTLVVGDHESVAELLQKVISINIPSRVSTKACPQSAFWRSRLLPQFLPDARAFTGIWRHPYNGCGHWM